MKFLKMDTLGTNTLKTSGDNGLVMCPSLEKFAEDCTVVEDSRNCKSPSYVPQ